MPRGSPSAGLQTPFADDTALAPDIEAALALGRLDGALSACPPATLRLFAVAQLRGMLIAALRQEGHRFTDTRFHAWFAGLVTLSDEPARHARAPRALVEAILTEMTHSSWEPLASLAARLLPALLAPQDSCGDDLTDTDAHETAHGIIAAARHLIAALGAPPPLPFAALAQLHRAISQDPTFAPIEPARAPLTLGSLRLSVERPRAPSPRWAIELLWGEVWRSAGLVRTALPWPGLIRLDAVQEDGEPGEARALIAAALRDRAQSLFASLAEAGQLAQAIAERPPGRRSTSRAPALFELLAGFGPLRCSQIETLLGVSRLGVRAILTALSDMDVVAHSTIAGVPLYAVSLPRQGVPEASPAADTFAFPCEAIDDFDASMAYVDELLARHGADLDDTGD